MPFIKDTKPRRLLPSERQWLDEQERAITGTIKHANSELLAALQKAKREVFACGGGVILGQILAGGYGATSPLLPIGLGLLITLGCGRSFWKFNRARKQIRENADPFIGIIRTQVKIAKKLEVLQEAGICSFPETTTSSGTKTISPAGYLRAHANNPVAAFDSGDMWGGSVDLEGMLKSKMESLDPVFQRKAPPGGEIPFSHPNFLVYLISLEANKQLSFTEGRAPHRAGPQNPLKNAPIFILKAG